MIEIPAAPSQPMSLIRQRMQTILAAVSVLALAVGIGFPSSADAASPQTSQKKPPKIYTNDDYPFNRPTSSASAESAEPNAASAAASKGERLAPFVPTPMPVVEKMLELAEVISRDVVYDLGSGDGRIVILAAQKYGARSVGIELDRSLAQESAAKVKELKLDGRVTIVEGDLLQADLKSATVVTLYLLVSANERLRPMLERDLKPGTRVVTHDMRMPGWTASWEEALSIGNATHFIYLYRVPEAFRK